MKIAIAGTSTKARTGNSNIHNPILVSYVAKGLLPYHGLGSGIKRALTHHHHAQHGQAQVSW